MSEHHHHVTRGRKILATDWAARTFDPPPSIWTLRRWLREGRVSPRPVKVGKYWYVEESARLVEEERPSLVDRLRAA